MPTAFNLDVTEFARRPKLFGDAGISDSVEERSSCFLVDRYNAQTKVAGTKAMSSRVI